MDSEKQIAAGSLHAFNDRVIHNGGDGVPQEEMPTYHKRRPAPRVEKLTTAPVGQRVTVCLCDTSATCVWSYPGIVKEIDGKLVVAGNDELIPVSEIDGCYTYLTIPK